MLDNIFGLTDLFNIAINGDGDRKGIAHGTNGASVYYSLPYGDTTFSLQAATSTTGR